MNKTKVGIVGLGTIANTHVQILSSFGDVEMKSATEVDIGRGKKFAKKWNIPRIYKDYNEMCEESDLDAVFICLPNFLHYDAVRCALEKGIHVFCEKPMGLGGDDAFELVKLARRRNLVLAVGYNKRLERNYEKSIESIKSYKLGNIIQAHAILVHAGIYAAWIPSSDWFFNDKCGVLYDLGSHLVDLIICMLSDRIVTVSAIGISTMHGIDVYDNVVSVFRTEKGVIGTFNVGWKIAAHYHAIQMHGTAGSLFADPFEFEIRHGSYGILDRIEHHIKSAKVARDYKDETYSKEDRVFIDAAQGKANPLVSGEDGLRVLEVLDAVKESLKGVENAPIRFHKF